jgi:hypothetical protein
LIVDGSVFVTARAGNPTSTIAALALRAGDHLLSNRRNMSRPDLARQWSAPRVSSRANVEPDPTISIRARSSLSLAARDRLQRMADVLIGASPTMPAAGPIVHKHLDRVLEVRPDLLSPLVTALEDESLPSEFETDELQMLAVGERFQTVRYVVAAAYYLDAGVRDALGYPGTVARPVRALAYPAYLEEGLLDHLV